MSNIGLAANTTVTATFIFDPAAYSFLVVGNALALMAGGKVSF